MSKYSRESLEKLLSLIDEIAVAPEHQWFHKELVKRCNIDESHLAFVRKEYKKKALTFYSHIKNPVLKKQLVKDHVEMSYYLLINNTGRFLLHVNYQLENLLNTYCQNLNVHEHIENSQQKLQVDFMAKPDGYAWKVDCDARFFNNSKPKAIKTVDIWAKIGFWAITKNKINFVNINLYNFHNIVNVRNVYGHRYSLLKDDNQVNRVLQAVETFDKTPLSFVGFYYNILDEVAKSI